MQNTIDTIYELYLNTRNVTTDSRSITDGSLFFALKGNNFDGNEFVPSAIEKGAAVCIVSDNAYASNPRCIVVDNVLATLQDLARLHRQHLAIPVIAITGTNGKTTTKELVAAALRRRYKVHATQGNYNNHLGVPLTLLSIPVDCEIAVVEMGANHPGEIADLCDIALPDYGLITNVGKAHLEGFGSFEGVVRTKTELYRFLDSHAGTIFVNADNDILLAEAVKCTNAMVMAYGSADNEALKIVGGTTVATATCIGAKPYMAFYTEDGDRVYNISTRLFGAYNYGNALTALAVARHFKVELYEIKEALEGYCPSNNRSQLKQTGRNLLLMDCYNANPTSMEAAVKSFAEIDAEKRVVMLGGMKELGAESNAEHRRIMDLVCRCDFDGVVLIGEEFAFARQWPAVLWFADSAEACAHFSDKPLSGAAILLKGSNSNHMWELEKVL